MIACTPATAASSGSFSPMRRATIAVVERLSPMPIAKISSISDSVSPTVATAFAPTRPTQNTSTTANSDSSTISSTIGIAKSKIARFRLPFVKSWCDPRTASRMDDHKLGCCASATTTFINLRGFLPHGCIQKPERGDDAAMKRKLCVEPLET